MQRAHNMGWQIPAYPLLWHVSIRRQVTSKFITRGVQLNEDFHSPADGYLCVFGARQTQCMCVFCSLAVRCPRRETTRCICLMVVRCSREDMAAGLTKNDYSVIWLFSHGTLRENWLWDDHRQTRWLKCDCKEYDMI